MFKSLRFCWRPFVPGDYDLAEEMITCWTNFAACGDPNGAGDRVWTPLTRDNPQYRIFRLDENDRPASGMGPKLEQ